MNAWRETIPDGQPGLHRKIAVIRDLVHQAKRDPEFRQATLEAVRQVPERDWSGEIRQVVRFVRKMRYTRDPYDPEGLELFIDPRLSIHQVRAGQAAGDCDDQVLLASAMLETLGHPTRYRVGGRELGDYGHIWIEVLHPRRGWVPIELTRRRAPVGWDPGRRFPHTETYPATPTMNDYLYAAPTMRGGFYGLDVRQLGPNELAGISRYLKPRRALKYLAAGAGLVGAGFALPHILPALGSVGSSLFSGGGSFLSGVMPALGNFLPGMLGQRGAPQTLPGGAQSYGSLFDQAQLRAGIMPGTGSIPMAREASAFDFQGLLTKVQRYAGYAQKYGPKIEKHTGSNPFRFLERFGLGWLPGDLQLPQLSKKLEPGPYPPWFYKELATWRDKVLTPLVAEQSQKEGFRKNTWKMVSMEETGVLEEYPARPGAPAGGKAAFVKDWGEGALKTPAFSFLAMLLFARPLTAHHPRSGSGTWAQTTFAKRADWLLGALLQVHAALWEEERRGLQQQKQQAQKKQQQREAEKQELARKKELAKQAEEARKLEQEQLKKELEHRKKMEELARKGATQQQIQQAEAEREAERRAAAARYPVGPTPQGPPLRPPVPQYPMWFQPPEQPKPAIPTGLLIGGGAALLLLLVLMMGRR